MTGCGQRGKPTAGFPRCPQPLEIAGAIPTFPPPRRGRGKVESPEAGLPTFPQHDLVVDTEFIKEARRRRYPPPSRLIVRLENASGLLALRRSERHMHSHKSEERRVGKECR